jgi:hypothetical protein
MSPKSSMLVVSLSIWMYAAITCAALPFFYAVPQLKSVGSMAPLIAALIVGALVSVPLSLAVRRLSGFNTPQKNVWATLTAREAVFFGIMCWGLPLGLMFALNEFLETSNPFTIVASVVVWPASGVAFGLLARWLGQRRGVGETA